MIPEGFDPKKVAEFENETWSRCASSYVDGFGALVGEAIAPLLDDVKADRGQRVLDVGTGPGITAAAARARGADVVGIDFSEPMVEEARRRHPNVTFQVASADDLPFDEDSFDAVVGNFVFHHLGDPGRVLQEARRVLRPGGRVGFTVWADLAKLEAFGIFLAAVEEHAGSAELPHGPLFGVSDFDVFHRMVRDAGLRDSSVRELPLVWHATSLEPYLQSFRDWANLASFPEEARTRIETTVRGRAGAYRSRDGYAMPNPAILVSAVK